jgi:hypothetical protein
MRPHLGNRIGLALVGLALVGAGAAALWLRDRRPGAPLLDPRLRVFLAVHAWAVPLAAVLLALVALVVTRWLVLATGWGRWGSRTGSGTAMLGVGLKGIDGVSGMTVRQVGDRRLRVSITCDPDVDLGPLVSRLDRETASRVRCAVGLPEAPVLVRLHVRRRPAPRP